MFKRIALVLLSLLLLTGCGSSGAAQSDPPSQIIAVQKGAQETSAPQNNTQESEPQAPEETPATKGEPASVPVVAPVLTPASSPNSTGTMKVHFIDVGQADSILIQSGQSAVLVDAGNNADGNLVVSYLKTQGVSKLAAVVATHPHEDHIGGMDTILKSFTVEKFYMPNASSTTKTFEDMLTAANASGAKKIQAKAGVVLDVPGISGTFLSPNGSNYVDLNNSSAVLKIIHSNTSFLLTGDAEDVSENEMLKNGNLQATLLKIGHHGSDSSTTSAFLKAVSPKFVVISVGKDNSYGHPADVVLSRLTAAGVQVYRTDQSGTILATSDGSSITLDKKASAVKANAPPPTPAPTPSKPVTTTPTSTPAPTPEPKPTPTPAPSESTSITVFKTKTGEKYHLDGCSSLSKSKIPVGLDDAKAQGLGPCSRCNPPQ